MIWGTIHSNIQVRSKDEMRMPGRREAVQGMADVENLTLYGYECPSPEGLTETLQTHSASTLEVLRAPAEF